MSVNASDFHALRRSCPIVAQTAIFLWGFTTHRLIKLQKRAISIITDSKYNSHTEPLLKSLNILKINAIFTIQCRQFFHNYINYRVPVFSGSFFVENALYHDYETIHCHHICITHSHTTKARKCIRYHIPMLLNTLPLQITAKLYTDKPNRICKLYKTAVS